MNKTYKFPALWMMCLMLFSCLTFTACDNGDDEDTNQYKGGNQSECIRTESRIPRRCTPFPGKWHG